LEERERGKTEGEAKDTYEKEREKGRTAKIATGKKKHERQNRFGKNDASLER